MKRERSKPIAQAYQQREELANTVSHGLSLMVAIVGVTFMAFGLPKVFSPFQSLAVFVYGLSLILMFLSSTLYHGVRQPKAKDIWKRLDHCAIYLLIAGTYTPIFAIAVQSHFSNLLLALVWSMALLGVLFKSYYTGHFERMSVAAYLVMAWSGLVMIYPIYNALKVPEFTLLILGGLTYSAGVFFYMSNRIPYNHAIWHAFVSLGALFHFWLIGGYIVADIPS